MDAPQSPADVLPIEQALQTLDSRLSIRWNPRAVVTRPGRYDASGHLIPAQEEGRWEIWRHADTGEDQRIHIVTLGGAQDGEYRPIDASLVEDMRQWDAENTRAFDALRRRLWAEHDRRHPGNALPEFQATLEEAWDTHHGGRTQFTGATFTQPIPPE